MKKYQHKDVEAVVAARWDVQKPFVAPEKPQGEKSFVIGMFPYPSGDGLHTGHARIFSAVDYIARYERLLGKSTLHAIGWDAFGLPAEQAALKKKINPIDLVPKNIDRFRSQLQSLGISVDWTREMATTNPAYYGFTQWIFLQLFKLGLAYKKPTQVWFCEGLGTVLSDEEVVQTPDGLRSERGNFPVERKTLNQWTLRITEYADRLLSGLDQVDWPAGIIDMQKNWIGKSEGAHVVWELCDKEGSLLGKTLTVFTTRIDTLPGVTFVIIAPEQVDIVEGYIAPDVLPKVKVYVQKSRQISDLDRQMQKEKTGVQTGVYVKNPLTHAIVPLYVAEYVLGGYGTGVVMGVPGHDERDFAFATAHKLPIIETVTAPTGHEGMYDGDGIQKNTGMGLDGMPNIEAGKKILELLTQDQKAQKKTQYKIRDWIFSRQRYWGEPFPMIFCEQCAAKGLTWWDTQEGKEYQNAHTAISHLTDEVRGNVVGWFTDEQLPLELPYVQSYEPSGDGTSPLSRMTEWKTVSCPHCGGPATRETDTMPNWAGSCWYQLYYAIPPHLRADIDYTNPFSEAIRTAINTWMPVDWYLGGAEHAVLHLLYARFWTKVLFDLGILAHDEPYYRLRGVGMVLGTDGKKMSKSLGNVINPDDVVAEYGADALRVYEAFMAPFGSEIAWNERAIIGAYRFLERIHDLFLTEATWGEDDPRIKRAIQTCVQKVSYDVAQIKFNTSIAFLMTCLNTWEDEIKRGGTITKETAGSFLQILSVFAPFLADYLWQEALGRAGSIALSQLVIPKGIATDEYVEVGVQVNGKVRGTIRVSLLTTEEEAVSQARLLEGVAKHIPTEPKKIIYKPGKILNLVV